VIHVGTAWPQVLSRRRIWTYAAVYGLLAAIVLYPIAMVTVPDLEDYPNHLARMYILTHYNDSAALQNFYDVRWRPIPYLGMDATFVLLGRIANIYDAGRLYVGLCVLLPVLSVAALHFAVHMRLSLVPAGAFLLSYNALLLWGFLNYLPVLCLAVIVFAGWITTTELPRWPRLIVFSALATVLYLGHVVAFGAYGLMLLVFESARAVKAGFRAWRVIAAHWLFAGLQAVPAIILTLSVKIENPFVGAVNTVYGTKLDKMRAILSPILLNVSNYEVFIGIVALVIVISGRLTGRLKFNREIFLIFVVVGLFSLCVPLRLLGVFGMDLRLPLLAAMLLLAAISTTERAGAVFKISLFCLLIIATAVRSARVGDELQRADRRIAELREVLSAMPKGKRLLTVHVSPTENQLGPNSTLVSGHASLVAVIDRDAFAPTLFTGIMTVKPKPEFRQLSTPRGSPYPDLGQLLDGYGVASPTTDIPAGVGGRNYWLGWELNFDYVLVTHYGNQPPPIKLPDALRRVASSDVAELYAVQQPARAESGLCAACRWRGP
jgi:hypothetical protein